MPKNLSKKTPYGWRHGWPGDTWKVPPGPTPASACRHSQSRHVGWLVAPSTTAGPAAIAVAGKVTWHPAAILVSGTLALALARPTGPSSNDDGADYWLSGKRSSE
jgi:hypothetical protein